MLVNKSRFPIRKLQVFSLENPHRIKNDVHSLLGVRTSYDSLVAIPRGVEPPTYRSAICRSIH